MTPVMLSLSSTFLYLTAAPSGSYVSSNVKQDDLLIVLLKVVFPMWTVGHSSLSWKYMFYVYILLPKFSAEEEKKAPTVQVFPCLHSTPRIGLNGYFMAKLGHYNGTR